MDSYRGSFESLEAAVSASQKEDDEYAQVAVAGEDGSLKVWLHGNARTNWAGISASVGAGVEMQATVDFPWPRPRINYPFNWSQPQVEAV